VREFPEGRRISSAWRDQRCATAVAAKSIRPKVKVTAAEPANADDAAQSFRVERLIRTEKEIHDHFSVSLFIVIAAVPSGKKRS
jgi:hypothetical protein